MLLQVREINGAGDETRTRDILLGRQKLYQLSYVSNTGAGGGNRTRAISLEG